MLYQISGGTLFFGANDVFENIDFNVNENEKIALVGRNGSGKTSLLKVITGEVELSRGQIYKNNRASISYLEQNAFSDENITALEAFNSVFTDLIQKEKELENLALKMNSDHSEETINAYLLFLVVRRPR